MAESTVTGRAPVASVLAWFEDSWTRIDADQDRAAFGRFEAGLLLVAAFGLVVMRFPARWDTLQNALDPAHPWHAFGDQFQWALAAVLGYVAVPVAYLKATGRSLRACNVGWSGTGRHLHVYALLAALMVVPVLLAASTSDYQGIYPYYEDAGRSWLDLLAWEAAYAAQFVALEFFFRGFLLEGLRPALGHAAIFVMVVPYCVIHFTKTGSEAVAAIVAGVVLGTMAMRWRSIWGGAFLHVWVAVGMDLAVLRNTGSLPDTLVP